MYGKDLLFWSDDHRITGYMRNLSLSELLLAAFLCPGSTEPLAQLQKLSFVITLPSHPYSEL